jgi:hypothetical protein
MNIQLGLSGASKLISMIEKSYYGVMQLKESGQCLKEGVSFSRKCAWYPALRGADVFIQDGQFAEFRKLVCEAPCRRDKEFQWGVCQRLGEIASSSKWDSTIRESAIAFLGEIYRNDVTWGDQPTVKQWVLTILMQLSSQTDSGMQCM